METRYTGRMCTIVAIRGVRSDLPLVLATNRDEFFERPSTGAIRLLDAPVTVGGRDLIAGGTWMGVTQDGLFVGVTNHRGAARTRRSRGELVLDALRLGDAARIADHVARIDGSAYNEFNLMWGDAGSLYVGYGRADRREVEIVEVPEGVHVLPNAHLDSPDFVKVRRANELLAPVLHAPRDAFVAGVQAMLGDRQLPSLGAIEEPGVDPELLRQLGALCVRTPSYGTRSSTVVLLRERGVEQFWVADGPPDRTPFVEVSPLFSAQH
ncbi:MAG TPA: NRDE family protein [Polyangiales bacterium]|nr:NRDE family protein [Polyangiales bacterium]